MDDVLLFVAVMAVIFIVFRLLAQWQRKAPEVWKLPDIKAVVICTKCDKKSQLKYKQGYIVGQSIVKQCKCGGERIIEKIYIDSESEKEKKWKRYEALFR